MRNNKFVYLIVVTVIVIAAGVIFSFYSNRTPPVQPSATPSPTQSATLANPASVYCQEQGGKSQIITAEDGSQSGDCVFSDGSKCDEWAFFRHECRKGGQANFSQQGKYLVIDGRPVFSYQEPGKPAARLDIFLRWNQFAILARVKENATFMNWNRETRSQLRESKPKPDCLS